MAGAAKKRSRRETEEATLDKASPGPVPWPKRQQTNKRGGRLRSSPRTACSPALTNNPPVAAADTLLGQGASDRPIDAHASAKLGSLQNDSMRSLLNVVDNLRDIGLNGVLSLPQLVVCGDQSSGKSSVLEAITQIPFPRDAMLCTRFVTSITLRREVGHSITAKIVPGDGRSTAHCKELLAFQKSITDFSKLPDLVREATKLMESADSGGTSLKAFFADVLSITVSAPEVSPLTLVDLPGLIHAETMSQSKQDVDFINSLVHRFISNPRSVILAVVSAKHDYANQIILQKARNVNPQGSRTLGIITKPYFLEEGSAEERHWAALAQNKDIHFELGWHMLRNRTQLESLATFEERDSTEKAFFEGRAIYQGMDKLTLGIGPLRERLSHLLLAHLKREIPKLREELNEELAKTSQRLAALGEQRDSLHDMRVFLTKSGTKCNGLLSSALSGQYNDNFFRDDTDTASKPVNPAKLRAIVRYQNSHFAQAMLVFGSKYEFNGVPSEVLDIIGNEKDVDNDGDLEYSRFAKKIQIAMSRSEAIAWALYKLQSCRGEELPGSTSATLMKELFWEQTTNWKAITLVYIEVVATQIGDFLNKLTHHVTPSDVAERVWQSKISPSMVSQKENAIAELERMINGHHRAPMTYNHYYTDTIQKLRHQKMVARAKGIIDAISYHVQSPSKPFNSKAIDPGMFLTTLEQQLVETDMEKFTAEEALDSLMALYKDKIKNFIARVAEEVVERHLVAPLLDSPISPVAVMKLSDDEVRYLAAESEHASAERVKLSAMKSSLEMGKKEFERALI